MSLSDIINDGRSLAKSHSHSVDDLVTYENLEKNIGKYRQLISFWRMYPDKLVEYYAKLNPDNTFSLSFAQVIFLRCVMRHNQFYGVFTRGFSKSFMVVLAQFIRGILYPGIKMFVVSPGKNQSAEILGAKMREICTFLPAISKEIIWDTRGTSARTQQTKDTVIYTFRNGSELRNVYASEALRGQRFNCGIMEECVGLDQDALNSIVIPTLNVDRTINGVVDPRETTNKSRCYITTASYKNTLSYKTLLDLLADSVLRPDSVMILGGTFQTSVAEGRLAKDFLQELKANDTYNEATFDMEYGSIWAGEAEGMFFNPEKIEKNRILRLAERCYNHKLDDASGDYYAIGVDVGRFSCATEIVVIKSTWSKFGSPVKQIVNIHSINKTDFTRQVIEIKRVCMAYNPKAIVVDGNGLGSGLIDLLTSDQHDPDDPDEILPNWGVINDEDGRYRCKENEDTIHNILWVMKANRTINSECYSYCQTQLNSGKLKFLMDESEAKAKLIEQEQYKEMTKMQQAEYLRPYVQTTVLESQMMNLIIDGTDNGNLVLKRANPRIYQDKFSALIYGLFYCHMNEEKNKHKTVRNVDDFMLFSPSENIYDGRYRSR